MSIKITTKTRFELTDKKLLSEYIRGIAWSTDGDCLAIISAAGELGLWHQGKLDILDSEEEYSLDCLGFSADGQWLAAAGQAGEIQIWRRVPRGRGSSDLVAFRLVTTLNYLAWIDSLAWNLQQNLLAFGVNRQIKIWDADSQKIVASLDFKDSSIFNIAWHPQGNLLAASGHGGVKIWQTNDWTQPPYFLEVPGASLDCAWSTDGKYIASGNLKCTISLLHWNNSPPCLIQVPAKVSQVTWSKRENKPLLAAACQSEISIWQFKNSQWHSQILKHQKTVKAIAFSPDSSLLASSGDDNYVQLWQDNQPVQALTKEVGGFCCLAWHPTGKYLAAGGQNGELFIWQQAFS